MNEDVDWSKPVEWVDDMNKTIRKARVLCTDARYKQPVILLVEDPQGTEDIIACDFDGANIYGTTRVFIRNVKETRQIIVTEIEFGNIVCNGKKFKTFQYDNSFKLGDPIEFKRIFDQCNTHKTFITFIDNISTHTTIIGFK